MKLFILTFLLIALSVLAMAVGVIFTGRTTIKGSCGGLNRLAEDGECPLCAGGPCEKSEGD